MTVYIKLGGSLITDKRRARAFRQDATRLIARQIKAAWQAAPGLRLVIGHGSGSFGHFAAQNYQARTGLDTARQRLAFAKIGEAATALSHLVLLELLTQGLPALRFQPSSFIQSAGGQIVDMPSDLIAQALASEIIPLLHGDVALDRHLGGAIISTERIFARLAHSIPARRIILLGEVDGVLDADGRVISAITPANINAIRPILGRSSGFDVTGGMLQKVEEMLALLDALPGLEIYIANGHESNILAELLSPVPRAGTKIALQP